MKRQNLPPALLVILASCVVVTTPCNSLAEDKIFETPAPRPIGIVAFVEGPAWHPTGNVYFSDGGNNRIMRRDRTGAMHVFRKPSGAANGLLFDFKGRLLACEGPGASGHLTSGACPATERWRNQKVLTWTPPKTRCVGRP